MTRRFFSNYVVWRSRLEVNSIVTASAAKVSVCPLEVETPATAYVEGIIAIAGSRQVADRVRETFSGKEFATAQAIQLLKDIIPGIPPATGMEILQIKPAAGVVKTL